QWCMMCSLISTETAAGAAPSFFCMRDTDTAVASKSCSGDGAKGSTGACPKTLVLKLRNAGAAKRAQACDAGANVVACSAPPSPPKAHMERTRSITRPRQTNGVNHLYTDDLHSRQRNTRVAC